MHTVPVIVVIGYISSGVSYTMYKKYLVKSSFLFVK